MANDGFVEVVSSNANAQVDALITRLERVAGLVNQINANPVTSPSTGRANGNAANDAAEASRRNRQTAEEIVNQRLLAQSADRTALANSRLAGEYRRLSAQQEIAARNLQNIVARGRTAEQTQRSYNRELRNAQNEFNRLNQRVIAADRAVGRFNRNVGNYPMQAVRGLKDLIGAFGIVGGVTLFATIAKDIFNTTRELQSLNLALTQVTGSQQAAADSMRFLTKIADDYGIEIKGLTKSYTQFYAAAADKLAGFEIKSIFDSVSKAAGAMGLSIEQQQGAFLALQQMISKGTVQAEELRGQLAERLPGAFGIMARSMGVTEVELNKLLKDGKVLAAEVLPAFARELEKAYGVENLQRVESLAAATTRLSNAWTSLVAEISGGDSAIGRFFVQTTVGLERTLGWIEKIIGKQGDINQKQSDNGYEESYLNQIKSLQEINDLSKERAKTEANTNIKAMTSDLEKLNAEQKDFTEQAKSLNDEMQSSFKEGLIKGVTFGLVKGEKQKMLDSVNDALQTVNDEIYNTKGQRQASIDFLTQKPKTASDTGGKTKRQKADIDYLREVYELRKQNIENEISDQERLMNDEENNYATRLQAASNYYFQKQALLDLELSEQNRLNDLELKNQTEQYRTAINEGKATYSNLDEINYKHIVKKEKINADYEYKKSRLAIDEAKKLQGVLAAIQDQAAKNGISKQQLDGMRQAGLILGNVGGNTSQKQFANIENQMRKLQQLEEDGQRQILEVDLRRTQEEKKRIVAQEVLNSLTDNGNASDIKDNEALNNLTAKELDLQKQILGIENQRKQAVADLYKEMKDATNAYFSSITDGFLNDAGFGSISKMFDRVTYDVVKTLNDGTKIIEQKVGSTFDKMFDQAQTMREKFGIAFQAVTEFAQEAFAFLNQNSQAYFDAQYTRLEREKDIRIGFAGESETARAEIERQYEEKRREIRVRELKQQKEQAMFNILINTSQAVVAALTSTPPNVPLSIIVGAIGLAQLAAVSSREIPAYADGVIGHAGGHAWVGDGGVSEIVRTPSGDLYRTPAKDTLVNLPKGSDVFKSEMDFLMNSGTLFGGVPHIMMEGGASAAEMEDIMRRSLAGAASNHIEINERGITKYTIRAGARTTMFNNAVSFRGKTIN